MDANPLLPFVESDAQRVLARWYTPYLGPEQPHRIVVLPNSGQPELASEAFA